MLFLSRLVRTVSLVILCIGISFFPAIVVSPTVYATTTDTTLKHVAPQEERVDETSSVTVDSDQNPVSESSQIESEAEETTAEMAPDSSPIDESASESKEGQSDSSDNITDDVVIAPSEIEETPSSPDSDNGLSKSDDLEQLPSEESTPTVETKGLLGVSLLTDIELQGNYDGEESITLRLIGRGVLDLDLLKNRYVLFKLPDSLIPYIDEASVNGTYDVPGTIGRRSRTISQNQWIIDREQSQIYFQANELLSLGVLSSYTFNLNFRIKRFPLITPQRYDFYGHMTNDVVDIRTLSDGRDSWALELTGDSIPTLSLSVPEQINFGNFGIEPDMGRINRQEAMTVTVSHSRAKGTPWQLTAQASPLQSPHYSLNNTVFFTRKDGTTVSLEQEAQLIETGVMADVPTTLDYGIDEGIHLDLQQQTPQPGTYNTIIEWTLIDSI